MLHSLTCILEKRRSEPPSSGWISEKIKLEALESICQLRLNLCDSTRAMQLAEFRDATVLDDEIYGLMSAARVVIYPPLDNNLSPAHSWQIWWTGGIREGHLRWALLPVFSSQSMTLKANPKPNQSSAWNCAMPVFGDYTQTSRKSTIDRVSTFGKVEIEAGTISAVGRLVGTVSLDVYLGKCDLSELDKLRFLALVRFDTSIVIKFWSAWAANHTTLADSTNPVIGSIYRSVFAKRSDEQEIRKRLLESFDGLNTYLGRLCTVGGERNILFTTTGEVPDGKLFALDFGARSTTCLAQDHVSEGQVLILVKAPQDDIEGDDVLHKLGVTWPVKCSPDINTPHGQPKAEQIYRFGGLSFSYSFCKAERQRLGLPEPEDTTRYDRDKPSTEGQEEEVRRVAILDETIATQSHEIGVLSAELARTTAKGAELEQKAARTIEVIAELEKAAAKMDEELAELKRELAKHEKVNAGTEEEIASPEEVN